MEKVVIDGESLTIDEVVRVARQGVEVELRREAKEKVKRCRQVLEKSVQEKKVVYGVTTGVGALGRIIIPPDDIKTLQTNVIRSHSAGVGKPISKDVTRALMLIRANTLAKGNSGIRPETLDTLIQMINKGVHPIIPEKGSVGASGDLAPLSHMALVIICEGAAEYRGRIMDGKEAMERAGIGAVELDSKEGLALNNGTQLMTALGVLALYDTERLIKTAEIATSLSLEALSGISDAFDEKIHRVRSHPGQMTVARNILSLIAGSQIIQSSGKLIKRLAKDEARPPQDPYSLRCAPQVLGAVRDLVAYVKKIIETEINSATDNPLIFVDEGQCLSCGNFHGQPVSMAMDILSIALTVIGNISERRTARLVDENLSMGLPAFLIHKAAEKGTNSGFMLAQVTAAALASENKSLAHPASVDSIPTSGNFEDFVSMGSFAARKAVEILRNVQYIIAIELLCAAQGVDFRDPDKLGRGTKAAHTLIRRKVPMLKQDRVISLDIETMMELVQNGALLGFVEKSLAPGRKC